jgi:hypothetical protein
MIALKNNYAKSDNFYSSQEDLLIKEGKSYYPGPFTEDEQEIIRTMFDDFCLLHRVPQDKQCYYNSQLAVTSILDREIELIYVEGLALTEPLPFPLPHGFMLFKGKVVDFTWFKKTKGIAPKEAVGNEYFGIQIHRDDLYNAMTDTMMAQSHLDNYWNHNKIYKKKFTNNTPYYDRLERKDRPNEHKDR